MNIVTRELVTTRKLASRETLGVESAEEEYEEVGCIAIDEVSVPFTGYVTIQE